MRPAIVAVAALLLVLAAFSMLGRSREREQLAERYFSSEEIARGRRFASERRLLFWTFEAAQLALLGWLALSRPGIALVQRVALASRSFFVATLAVGAAVFLARQLLALPWSVYGGLYHLRAWGLTDRSLLSWAGDYAKALGVSGLLGALLLLGFYGLLRVSPRFFFLFGGLASALVAACIAYLAPLLIAPLFNEFVPLRTTPYAALQPRIEALAQEAGLPVQDVLVMDASRQGRHTNAYFTGFFGTRRIVLYDTLLKSHGEQETLSILGHEMGHWRHHHIVKGIALGTLGAFAGLFALQRLLERAAASGRFGLKEPADPAGLPLLLLLVMLGGWLSQPLENAISRGFEREADHDALLLYGHPEVFIEAEKRLARDNIANVAPTDLNVFLFATHPPTLERIAAAERAR